MADDKDAKPANREEEAIQLVEVPTGEEVALGMSAQLQEGMTAQGSPPVTPPPKPPDASSSAKPSLPSVPLDQTTALIDYEGRDNGAGKAK